VPQSEATQQAFCSFRLRCVRRAIATEQPGVAHIDVDLTHRADLANKFNILQTPTTLILDRDGTIRARIGGAVKRATVIAELDNFLAPA
jgi:thioredoxin-related protein